MAGSAGGGFWGASPTLEKRALASVTPFAAVLLRSVTVAGLAVVVPIAACYPLATVFLSVLALGEKVRWWHVLGVVLILSGMMLVSQQE